jgi:molecular chaperone Hsp33
VEKAWAMTTRDAQSDRVLRAMSDDGGFRLVALRTTTLAQDAARAHGLTGSAACLLGELLTAAVLVRETMAPDQRVQATVQASDGGRLLADSFPDGRTRGLVRPPAGGGPMRFGPGALLQVSRVLHGGRLHQSVVSAAGPGGLSGALSEYLQASEQVTSATAVACVDDPGGITACGGFLVQLLPGAPHGPLAVLTERMADFADLGRLLEETDGDADHLASEVFYGMAHTLLARSEVRWGCPCDAVRVVSAMASLGAEELRDVVAKGEVLEVACDYCGEQYQVGPEQLRALLEPS